MRLAEHLLSLSTICKHGRMSRQRRLGMSASITSGGGYWGFSLLAAKLDRKLYPMNRSLSKQAIPPFSIRTCVPRSFEHFPSTHPPINPSLSMLPEHSSQPTHALDAQAPQLKAK